MATTTTHQHRQPFAPLNSSRLQSLVNLKNRQNAAAAAATTLSPPSKRKATTFEHDDNDNHDTENIDPIIFLSSPKRSKGLSADSLKPQLPATNFFLTRASLPPKPRPILNARAPRLETKLPLSAPAGRSPTRKRIGILNRRKTTAGRVDPPPPPRFAAPTSSTGLGFSIDAALSGTIPSYSSRQASSSSSTSSSSSIKDGLSSIPLLLHQPEAKPTWFFDIHEDTEEELATNLMEHGACTLDISSDEEGAGRERDARGKENVPPVDDVSQTSRGRRAVQEEGSIEVDRSPLGDLCKEDFYAEGVAEGDVFVVREEEEGEEEKEVSVEFDFAGGEGKEVVEIDVVPELDVETLMQRPSSTAAPKAALLQPIEKAEEGFELWESGSAKDGE
ncbi:uncharacterized protein LY89DRAFT_684602 [Mollisia scopiformis]|uniref:Thymidylate kinase protein n=1 Tax=Mollisia scopiformis TaxID=149040 RepID=A0A194XBQ6_MOLSC|nr:uncharacterized protein LY89DRAFT_684602 [Mollisia scopiformis]KUJ17594.1 hypothetical protein LY89DRAFT_684602 [Mollisia scopiformis]